MNSLPQETPPVLTLRLSQDGALQQVLNLPSGAMQVGETADFLNNWSLTSVVEGDRHPLASKVHQAVGQIKSGLTISAPRALASLPWEAWLGKQIRWQDLADQPAHQEAVIERSYRNVVSLSYDIANSTELMAQLGAENYSELINHVHSRFAQITQEWSGKADLPQGDDGCMCYFGADHADEHAPLSALQAAYQMQSVAAEQRWSVRIGLAQGWVAVNAGQPVGLSVHLAARIQKAATVGAVWLTQDIQKLATQSFAFARVGINQVLKGFDSEIHLSQLLGPQYGTELYSNDISQVNFGADLCLGREAHLASLASAWSDLCAGQGRDCFIHGLAGIGKSTLLRHALKLMPSAKVIHLRSSPYDNRIVFATLATWLANELGVPRHLSKQQQAAIVLRSIQIQKNWLPFQSAIQDILDLPEQKPTFEEPVARHNKTMQSMLDWVKTESSNERLVIVIDDYQWADASTQHWVKLLQKSLHEDLPLLLIISQRSDQKNSALYQNPDFDIEVTALSTADSNKLIGQFAPKLASNPHWLGVVQARAQGIPLFLRETALLFNSDALQQQFEHARKLGQPLKVPVSLQDLLMQRLDQLGDLKKLAQTASVIGQEFSWLDVQALHKSWQVNLAQHSEPLIQALLKAGVFVALQNSLNQIGSEAKYAFSHGLLRDVAYQSMWEADRKRLHSAAAQYFSERASIDPLQITQLARHWAAAGETSLAIDQLMAEGKASKKRGAHGVAIDCMETALELLQTLAVTSDNAAKRIDAHLALAGQIMVTQGYAATAVHEHSLQAVQLSHTLSDSKGLLRAQLSLQSVYFMRGHFAQAHRLLDESTASAVQVNHPLTTLQHQWACGNLAFYEGDFLATERIMAGCVQWCTDHDLGGDLIQNPKVMAQMYRAYSLWCLGRAGDALEAASVGCQLADAGNHRLTRVQAHGIAAMVYYGCGLWSATLASAEAAYASCAEGEYALWLAHAGVMRGAAIAQLGQVQEGIAQMRANHQQWSDGGGVLTRSYYWALEAEILKNNHDLMGSKSVIAQAKEMMMKIPERYYASEVRRISACLQWDGAADADTDTKESAYEQLTYAYTEAISRHAWGLAIRVATSMLERSTGMHQTELANECLVECVRHIQSAEHFPYQLQGRNAQTSAQIIELTDFRKTAS